ncbi:MAG: zinc metallopeptidase [Clostridia bacterium]|nr:zinc metallopeptidase [Clostridia bacterium]
MDFNFNIIIYIVVGVLVAILIYCLAVASFGYENFRENLNELNQEANQYGFTTRDFVDQLNNTKFEGKVELKLCNEGEDHFSPNYIALSHKTLSSNSLASLAIVAHEMGHAEQYKNGVKLEKHWKRKRTGRALGKLFVPLVIIGIVVSLISIFEIIDSMFVYAGLGVIGLAVMLFLFAIYNKFMEIKIEKEASDFAIKFLKEYLNDKELKKCKTFLDSARLTYWADLYRTMFAWTMLTGKTSMFK